MSEIKDWRKTPADYEFEAKMQELERRRLELENKSSEPKKASVIGRGVAGAIIAGPVGAVVGSLSAVDKNYRNK